MKCKFPGGLHGNHQKIGLYSLFVCPVLLVLVAESIQRGNLLAALAWLFQEPLHFILTVAWISAIYTFLLFLCLRPFFSFFPLAIFLITLSIISYNKTELRGLPVLPWNMLLMKELILTIKTTPGLLWIFYTGVGVAFLGFTVLIVIFGGIKLKASLAVRGILLTLSLAIGVSLFFYFGRPSISMDIPLEYSKKGLISAFSSYLSKPWMEPPMKISEQETQAPLPLNREEPKSEKKLPDLFFIMEEAFWDPTLLKNVHFSSDPLPNFHRLQRNATHGTLMVNTFGGNTTATEFEVLTGMSLSFFQPEVSAYCDFYHGQVGGLPIRLKELGYKMTFIHPNDPGFLNRAQAIPALGFDSFVSLGDFVSPMKIGEYVSDESTGEKILELYKKHLERSPSEPYFSFTTTIQNHFDYAKDRYSNECPIHIECPQMTAKELNSFKNYIHGLYDADRMLGKLIQELKAKKRPVVVVFFGDHLPAIGSNFQFYKKGGLISKEFPKGAKKLVDAAALHSTPFLIWDNFSGPALDEPQRISAAYLQALLFKKYSLPLNNYQTLMKHAMERSPELGLASWPQLKPIKPHFDVVRYQNSVYEQLFLENR